MGGRKAMSGKRQNKDEGGGDAPAKTKPKFDKKKWRERKYSHKFKISKWEEKREKSVIQQFYKELKKDPNYAGHFNPNRNKQNNEQDSTGKPESQIDPNSSSVNKEGKKKKLNSYQAAQAEIQRIKEERRKEKEANLKRKQEMEAKLDEYKKKRAEKYKTLSQKNSKGQPLLKGRLQLLYEQIKQSTS